MSGALFDDLAPMTERERREAELAETARRFGVRPTARGSDPDTSHDAARQTTPRSNATRLTALGLLAMAGDHGATDFELAAQSGLQQTSIGVRRGELVRMGYAEASGRTRQAPSGSRATVWVVTPAGERFFGHG
jgi:hypothetical protein